MRKRKCDDRDAKARKEASTRVVNHRRRCDCDYDDYEDDEDDDEDARCRRSGGKTRNVLPPPPPSPPHLR